MLNDKIVKKVLVFQKNEITEYIIYKKLSKCVKDANNSAILNNIADDELRHYNIWKTKTLLEVEPDRFKIWKYFFISKIFGLTFGIKLMEKDEEGAQKAYGQIAEFIPETSSIIEDENGHEKELINLIDEEALKYVGSVVLGLSDALVELTGVLAGLTLALNNTRLVAIAGLITGIAAALSMAASEYLSTKSEEFGKSPIKACVYTGIAYILTVLFLVAPFLIFKNLYLCLGVTLVNALIVIFIFTYYISIAKGVSFKKRFLEMAGINLGVAAISYCIGFFVKTFLGVDA